MARGVHAMLRRFLDAGWAVTIYPFGADRLHLTAQAMAGQVPSCEYVDVDDGPQGVHIGLVALWEAIEAAQAAWPPTLVVDDALADEVLGDDSP